MIELISTAESMDQAKVLLDAGIDTLYVGEDEFGLRLPASFSKEEIAELVELAHAIDKRVYVAVNAIMHNDRLGKVVPYLQYLASVKVDAVTIGDPGVIRLLKINEIDLPYIYDAQTLVTSSKQINFWAKRGAVGAVLAREITKPELVEIGANVQVPVEILVYGATCIHHSKRPLAENYFNFIGEDGRTDRERGLFISEPKAPETHYSIYEDMNGTHVFANNDINLLEEAQTLEGIGIRRWKLDGLYTAGENFVEIARIFIEVKNAVLSGSWNEELAIQLNTQLKAFHPAERGLDKGFYVKDPNDIQ